MTNLAENLAMLPEPEILKNSAGEEFNLSAVAKGKIDIETAMIAALEEARDVEEQAENLKGEREVTLGLAETIADKPILMGARAIHQRALTKEEISNLLGKVHGFKPKADGTPGKTPAGTGLSIRKRIVTLSEAMAIADSPQAFEGDNCPTWAKGIDPADIASTIQRLENGELSAAFAYRTLGELKPKAKAKALALDTDKLKVILTSLASEETIAAIRANGGLQEAWRAIAEAITPAIAE